MKAERHEGAASANRPHRPARRPRRWPRWAWLPLLIVGVGRPSPVRADGVAALDALEAAYTFHFLNLIRWERPSPLLNFCVLGESEAGERMRSALSDKTVHGQRIQTRRLANDDLPEEPCDAVYIPSAARGAAVPALLKRYESSATLTISDVPEFAQGGGVIGFVVIEDRLRFDINERIAARKGLKISAKLLELARTIVR